jgi:hypothetical protein
MPLPGMDKAKKFIVSSFLLMPRQNKFGKLLKPSLIFVSEADAYVWGGAVPGVFELNLQSA